MAYKTETTGYGDIRRIMRDDRQVGVAMRVANGKPAAYDPNEPRLTAMQFDTPTAVRSGSPKILIMRRHHDQK